MIRINNFIIPLFSLIIFCLLWELLVWYNNWPNYKMASPSDLWPAFWKFKHLFLIYGCAIPKATVVPVIALIFVGMHNMNTIIIVILISFFPICVSISIGLSTLEREYEDILLSLGANKFEIFYKIALPKTLPEFFGALKVSTTLAFIGTNLMEIIEPHGKGLGHLFDSGKISADYPLMFAVLITLAVMGIFLYYIVVYLENIFAGWAIRK